MTLAATLYTGSEIAELQLNGQVELELNEVSRILPSLGCSSSDTRHNCDVVTDIAAISDIVKIPSVGGSDRPHRPHRHPSTTCANTRWLTLLRGSRRFEDHV